MTLPRSLTPDQLRRDLKAIGDRVTVIERGSATAATAATWSDNTPRSIALTVAYTDFIAATDPTPHLLVNLPAGTVCTHQWVEPGTLFVSPLASIWRLSIVKSAPIYSAAGTAKAVDVTTPDGIDQQHAAELIVSDSATANDWYCQIESGSGENGDTLTAGDAVLHLLVSVPGSTADTLPHS